MLQSMKELRGYRMHAKDGEIGKKMPGEKTSIEKLYGTLIKTRRRLYGMIAISNHKHNERLHYHYNIKKYGLCF